MSTQVLTSKHHDMGRNPGPHSRESRLQRFANGVVPHALIAPGLLLVLIVMLYPTFHGVVLSFFDTNTFTRVTSFVGFGQYIQLFRSPEFLNALTQTFVLVAGTVIIGIVTSIINALVLHHVSRGGRIWRTIVLIPWLISGIAVATIWRALFQPTGGYSTAVVMALGLNPVTWFASPFWSMSIIILASVWAISPFSMLIIYSGLQMVNPDMYEAAAIDGANALQRFAYITAPSVAPQFSLAMVFLSVGAVNSFEIIMLMTGGGPGRSTEVLAILLYRLGFDQLDFHAAAACMVLLLAINLMLSVFYLKLHSTKG